MDSQEAPVKVADLHGKAVKAVALRGDDGEDEEARG